MPPLEITFEVKEVKTKKQGLDLEFRVVLITEDRNALALAMLKADTLIKAKIEAIDV